MVHRLQRLTLKGRPRREGAVVAPLKGRDWTLMARDPAVTAAALALLGFAVMALIPQYLAPYDPYDFSWTPLQRPSLAHPLGTNNLGQDILSEVIYGARISLLVGFTAAALSSAVAWALGLLAGYFPRLDAYITTVADGFMAIPKLPLIILLVAFLGPSLWNVILVLGLFTWPPFMRVIRAQTLITKEKTFVEAARALGAGNFHILKLHILPDSYPLIAAKFILSAQNAVFAEATLAFLGLSDPAAKSWGLILNHALNYPLVFMTNTWLWWVVPPALCIALLVVSLALLGHALERSLNPKLRYSY